LNLQSCSSHLLLYNDEILVTQWFDIVKRMTHWHMAISKFFIWQILNVVYCECKRTYLTITPHEVLIYDCTIILNLPCNMNINTVVLNCIDDVMCYYKLFRRESPSAKIHHKSATWEELELKPWSIRFNNIVLSWKYSCGSMLIILMWEIFIRIDIYLMHIRCIYCGNTHGW
jgi:hypothetical protein